MGSLNTPIVIIVAIAAVLLIIWMIRRDQKDKKDFEQELMNTEVKPETDKDKSNDEIKP